MHKESLPFNIPILSLLSKVSQNFSVILSN